MLMLIFYLVLSCCAVICCVFGTIIAIRSRDWGAVFLILFLVALWFIALFAIIKTGHKGNAQNVEYYFPADHYTFEQIITETNETKYVGNDTLVVTKRDTTYKLVGQDPIIGGNVHFLRKYPD